ncbi:F-box domain-containing protein [Orpheovirus IHUMI-LCC2]|uniref:F-box domain-containing protein n=1 Tax=Orpheovirus IHUMI-LCC2 TaxID=2023057 RepID=A0A2I2L455_9VIRU|nr:F-box domain-containing protein [Orpheovirus IHUMI-LCC2]SNW62307.1 F-box domain-containing protein [Orpheovirus IHUMI-LCC2]
MKTIHKNDSILLKFYYNRTLMEILNNDCIYTILTHLHPYYSISLSKTCRILYNLINSKQYHNYLVNVYMNNPPLIKLHRTQLMLVILYTNPIKESVKYYFEKLDDLLRMSLESKSSFEDISCIINCNQKVSEWNKKSKKDSIINFAYQLVGKQTEPTLDPKIVKYIIKYNRNDLCYQYLGISCREALIKLLKSGKKLTDYMGCLELGIKLLSIISYCNDDDIRSYVINSRDIISLYKSNPEILEIACLQEMKLGYNLGLSNNDILYNIGNNYKYPSLLLFGYLIGSSIGNNINIEVKLRNINKIRMMDIDEDIRNIGPMLGDHIILRSRRDSKIYSILSEEELVLYRTICKNDKIVLGIKEYYNNIFDLFLSSRCQYDKVCRVMYKEYAQQKGWMNNVSYFLYANDKIERLLVTIRNIPGCTLYCIQGFIEKNASNKLIMYLNKRSEDN